MRLMVCLCGFWWLGQCTRMEMLLATLKRVRADSADVFGPALAADPAAGLEWSRAWLDQVRS